VLTVRSAVASISKLNSYSVMAWCGGKQCMAQSWIALTDYLVLIYLAFRQGVPAAPQLHIKVDMVH
jgi:hypothetical protein